MHGILVLDKPAGASSAQTLAPLKRLAGRGVKVGHAGTLDPFATGVLLALFGDATRLSRLAMDLPKTYAAEVLFGETTDTLDPLGEVRESADPGGEPPPGLTAAAASFAGEIEQLPPAYSALKVDGRRAYRIARGGGEPDLAPRRVRVHGIEVIRVRWPLVTLQVQCGAGTYLRSIARDLGGALGLPARLETLRRVAVGPFKAADAPPAPTDRAGLAATLRPPLDVVRAAGLPTVGVAEEELPRLAWGNPVHGGEGNPGLVAIVRDGVLLALGESRPGGTIQPKAVLSPARESSS